MKFGGHQSFHLRDHWLYKGSQGIQGSSKILSNPQKSMEKLGVGKNMMESIRYWLKATQLIEEDKANFVLTKTAQKILEKDPYFELDGTLLLIHYLLVTNKQEATTWYWFFNHFLATEFDKESLASAYHSYVQIHTSRKIKDTTIDKDLVCLLRMYQAVDYAGKKNPETETPSPFTKYGWIEKKKERFIRNKSNITDFDSHIFSHIFYLFWRDELKKPESIKLEELAEKENSIGRIFQLNIEEIGEFIEICSKNTNYFQYSRTGGYLIVRPEEKSLKKALDNYYKTKTLPERYA